MSWHAIVGFCALLSALLAYITTALPGKYSSLLALIGGIIIAVDRYAIAHENSTAPSVKVTK